MTNELHNRTVAFLRQIANQCYDCHVRGDACYTCIAKHAKILLMEIMSNDNPAAIDDSYCARVKEIKRILTEAEKPLLAREIDLKQMCSPQLKYWTLNQMAYMNIIERKFAFRSKTRNKKKVFFYYYLKKGDE